MIISFFHPINTHLHFTLFFNLPDMEIPVINFDELNGEKRNKTMEELNQACENWGFFQAENHGIDKELMEKVKNLVNLYYEIKLKERFYESETAKSLEKNEKSCDIDWESSFFIWHQPVSSIHKFQDLPHDFCSTMEDYITQLINLAERLSELMCTNLGLPKHYIKQTFSTQTKGPSVGTKVAKYPQCPNPNLVKGLREHTDAGGIILLLQDDTVPGLEFFKDGKWVAIPPSKNNTIFVNIGDQIEVLSNGRYKSCLHRVLADKNGSRLSIATFYNPNDDAIVSPAEKLVYPCGYWFHDYLKIYGDTKFLDKWPRFDTMKKMGHGEM